MILHVNLEAGQLDQELGSMEEVIRVEMSGMVCRRIENKGYKM